MTWNEFEMLPAVVQVAVVFAFVAALGFVGYAVESLIATRREQKAMRTKAANWWEKYRVD